MCHFFTFGSYFNNVFWLAYSNTNSRIRFQGGQSLTSEIVFPQAPHQNYPYVMQAQIPPGLMPPGTRPLRPFLPRGVYLRPMLHPLSPHFRPFYPPLGVPRPAVLGPVPIFMRHPLPPSKYTWKLTIERFWKNTSQWHHSAWIHLKLGKRPVQAWLLRLPIGRIFIFYSVVLITFWIDKAVSSVASFEN